MVLQVLAVQVAVVRQDIQALEVMEAKAVDFLQAVMQEQVEQVAAVRVASMQQDLEEELVFKLKEQVEQVVLSLEPRERQGVRDQADQDYFTVVEEDSMVIQTLQDSQVLVAV